MNIPSVDKGPGHGLAIGFLVATWVTLALRMYTRLYLVRNWYAEDTAMVICLLFYTVFGIATVETARLTELGAENNIPLSDVLIATTWFFLTTIFYIIATMILKLSLGLFFVRVAVLHWRKVVIGTEMVILTFVSAWAFFLIIFHCGAFENIQDLLVRRLAWTTCAPDVVIVACVYTHASIVALVDWTFFVLPFFILRTTRIERKEKWIIGPLMMLASVGGLASLVRFRYCGSLGIKGSDILAGSADLNIWSTLESSIGICAANIACLRPLFRQHILPWTRSICGFYNHHRSTSSEHAPPMGERKPSFATTLSFSFNKSKSSDKSVSQISQVQSEADEILLHPVPANLSERKMQSWQLPRIARLPAIRLSDIEEARDEDIESEKKARDSWIRLDS